MTRQITTQKDRQAYSQQFAEHLGVSLDDIDSEALNRVPLSHIKLFGMYLAPDADPTTNSAEENARAEAEGLVNQWIEDGIDAVRANDNIDERTRDVVIDGIRRALAEKIATNSDTIEAEDLDGTPIPLLEEHAGIRDPPSTNDASDAYPSPLAGDRAAENGGGNASSASGDFPATTAGERLAERDGGRDE